MNVSAEKRGGRATRYSQVHPTKMAAGDLRIAFASITPIEKGFFLTTVDPSNWKKEVVALFSGKTLTKTALSLLKKEKQRAGHHATGVLRNNGPFRLMLQRVFMGYSFSRIRFLKSPEFDYWEEYLKEISFYENGLDKEVEGWSYRLIDSAEALQECVASQKELAMILTIEGAHTFSVKGDDSIEKESIILSRIADLKAQTWPVFFITFSHHFYNGLCGHAKSIMDSGCLIMNQEEGLGEGFTTLGWRALRELLSIDDKNRDLDGARILIDCKHMSPLGRKQFYENIVTPYNRRRSKKREKIPVIISHAAYNTFSTLEELINNIDQEDDDFCREGFLAWGINYCDEDIRIVVQSEGLIGLCFDRRICGVRASDRLTTSFVKNALIKQIIATVEVAWTDESLSKKEKTRIWNCISIGTDFDGLIDPLPRYSSATSLSLFAEDLKEALELASEKYGILEIGVEEIVEKISWRNAYDFGLKHLKGNQKL